MKSTNDKIYIYILRQMFHMPSLENRDGGLHVYIYAHTRYWWPGDGTQVCVCVRGPSDDSHWTGLEKDQLLHAKVRQLSISVCIELSISMIMYQNVR